METLLTRSQNNLASGDCQIHINTEKTNLVNLQNQKLINPEEQKPMNSENIERNIDDSNKPRRRFRNPSLSSHSFTVSTQTNCFKCRNSP